ncbi:chromosome segregation protein SMC [Nitrosomonas sp. Nm132]|uniref:chromosome segregation protein SMC n=1 Tax=Nitrosomonas sp. Nm132 TaxID=1881053 RepID=UPI00087F7C9E|nr:chromosome segregation protein SMC [Nitrosomonas sp. Nm132]SDH96170.1 condensin subunit Smc [Nitrosomonas sp. Nm132]
MRLSQIKLAGFKSFVDPTTIPIPGNLVGIVGPNGCGKSNVIDAVRWVLGESRATALRGESIQDVIFSGSVNRKPVGRASVELIFDNKLGKVASQWAAYSEISIKRVIQRDSESAYYINNTHVRRRDITDIFLGTGVSGRGYAIIEQGMISRIIDAKPMELRIFLEEAAGISKYRDRRHETELRLTDTRGNLMRVEDILQELGKQLQRLEAQANIARKFSDLQKRLNTACNILWLIQKQEAITKRIHAEEAIQQLGLELENKITSLHEMDQQLEEMRAQQYALSDRQHQMQGELYSINAEIARIEQRLQHAQESREYFAKQISTIEMQLQNNQQQMQEALAHLTHWRQEIEQAELACISTSQNYYLENEKLPEAESAFRSSQDQLFAVQKNLLLAQQTEKLQQSHLIHTDKAIQQLNSRHERLIREKNSQPEIDQKELTSLVEEKNQILVQLEEKQRVLTEAENQLKVIQHIRKEALQNVQSAQQELTQAKAQHAALQRIQCRLENNKALDTWLSQLQLDLLPRLWQYIQIEKGWENALEAVLRERINAAVVEQLEIALNWKNNPPPGKWSIFETTTPINNQSTSHLVQEEKQWSLLSSYLIYTHDGIQPVVETWLNGIFTISDIEAGLTQQKELIPGEMLITPEGHVFTYCSLSYYAPDSHLHGVLARQREITQIEADIDKFGKSLSRSQLTLSEIEETCHELEATISELHSEILQLKQQEHELQLEIVQLSQLMERVSQRHRQIEDELIEISHQISVEYAQKQEAEIKLAENKTQIANLEEQLQQIKLTCEVAEQSLATQRLLIQNLAEERREAVFHEKNCQNKIEQLKNDILAINQSTDDLTETLEKLHNAQDDLDDEPLKTLLNEWLAKRIYQEQILTSVRHDLENTIDVLREIEQARVKSEQISHQLRDSINQTRLKEQEARLTENQFNEKLLEVGAKEDELLPLLISAHPPRLKTEINRINTEITALGAVNLAALEELQASQARKAYLDEQSSDLKEAVATLENAIRQIDRETQERLTKTFDKVNTNLSELFTTIFGGGQAKLVLSGEEILDAGMQLTAQPPGKKNNSIHLLSGGEKALTALALVFSLFQLNPAPFCLLDEVDAPLDDNNSERFCDLVKRMSRETQFLFISHSKTTIQMAEQLIGVTMQEQGVSRIVTVDFDKTINFEKEIRIG